MGFWHTGYGEFHEANGLEDVVLSQPPPVRYGCEHCAEQFADMEALRRHRFEQHPLRQPLLLVRGRAVGRQSLKVMTSLQASDVAIEDVSHCRINGRSVPPKELGACLAAMSREFVEIELGNSGATTQAVLDFRIADEAHLQGVESSFLRMARDRVLNIEAVARFIRDCESFASASLYCDGICQYLYGVMAKEQTADSGLSREQYLEKFNQATDTLAGFDRRLSRSVRGLVAFHFNHFDDAEWLAPEGALRETAAAFSGLLQGLPWHFDAAFESSTGTAVESLLTDQDTLQVLTDASRGLVELKARAEELLAHLGRAPSTYDRLKRALLATEALAAREDADSHAQARRLAREWSGQPATRDWADAMIQRLTPS